MAKSLLLGSASAAVLATTALSVTAYAQDSEDAVSNGDTIVVTATRRAETVQDIPINIAAVGAEQIEEQGFDELDDFLAYVPGINIVDRGGRQGNPIIVRGINADPLGSGDGNNDGGGTVATYVGEIPVYIDLKLNDMERVEVLLGPQGTLYGAGTLGGAIRYIPKRPDFETDSLSVRAEAYQYSEADDISTDFGFTFNKTISDTFAIRGSLDMRNDSGFIDQNFLVREIGVSDPDPDFTDPAAVAANLRSAKDVDSEDTISGRIAARWMPTDWVDANLTYYYQQADIGGRTINSSQSNLATGDYVSATRVPEPNEITNELLALEVVADLGFAELTSATGISKFEDDGQRDQTDLLITLQYSYDLFPTFTSFTREIGEEERLNQEIRLVSTTDSRFNWIVGAFYNKLETVGSSSEFTPGYDTFALANIDDFFFDDFGGIERADDLEYFAQSRSETIETAFFGEFGFDITDRWDVVIGGRIYDYEIKSFVQTDLPLFNADFVPLSLGEIRNQPFNPDLTDSDDGTLFKFNTSYDINDDTLVYLTISEGFRLGDSNGRAECEDFDTGQQTLCALAPGQEFTPGGPENVSTRDERRFGPDTTTNYEIGVKSVLADGALTLNGAVYFIEWTDPQLSSATVNGNLPITVNADGAESKGFEVSANWNPTDRWNIRGSYSHVESELTEPVPALVRFFDNDTRPFGTGFEDGQPGDRLPGSPEDQFSFFTSYDQTLENGNDLTWNFGYSYQSDVLTRANSRGAGYVLDGFGIANASVVYDAGDWSATLFVDNVFDEYAETGATSNRLANVPVLTDLDGGAVNVRSFRVNVAPPRAIGVRLNWDITGGE